MSGGESKKGIFEGLARVLSEVLKSHSFKKKAGIVLENLDPENASLVVRTLMWQDPSFFLSIVGSAPSLVNSAIYGFGELVSGFKSFTPDVLAGFITNAMREIDFASLGESLGLLTALYLQASSSEVVKISNDEHPFGAFWAGLRRGFAKGYASEEYGPVLAERISEFLTSRLLMIEERLAADDPTLKAASDKLIEAIGRIKGECPNVAENFLRPLGDIFKSDDCLESSE